MSQQAAEQTTGDVVDNQLKSKPEEASTARAWIALADFVLRTLGLFYPQNRMGDLRRNFAKASVEFGYADQLACIRWIVGVSKTAAEQREVTQVLARHLTIGETYFLRDRSALEALESSILPKLIEERRACGNLRLRIWCAACCTGEEAYTLAILVHRLLPDLANWQITITASDLNSSYLQKARAAIYGEWSFRDTPSWLKTHYFKRMQDGRYQLIDEIRRMVDFVQLNLIDAPAEFMPGPMRPEIMSMDVVFCRNVLMYFDSTHVNKAVALLSRSLVGNGWLAVGPGETASVSHELFSPVSFPGAVLLRKNTLSIGASARPDKIFVSQLPLATSLTSSAPVDGVNLGVTPIADASGASSQSGAEFDFRVRQFVREGRSDDALAECDRWLAADKLNAAAHYLRGAILMEQTDHMRAQESLQRAAYLDPEHILAQLGLGQEALRRNETARASKHFANASRLLSACEPAQAVPEGDGITAEQVSASLRFILNRKALS